MAFAFGDITSSMAAKSAAIVVDAKTGKVLYSSDANGRRYPASLTKMMTLYLTFEALAKGRISKNTPVPFSARASAEPPTKLGVKLARRSRWRRPSCRWSPSRPMTRRPRSAKCSAAVEPTFARMMTAKARALGMNGTVFRNANGLPDPGQFTTAHDMAMLGIALREHFRSITAISRSAPSFTAASASTATTACSAASRASTASRPATPAPPASTSSRRFPMAIAASSPSSWAAVRAAAATTRWPR